MPFVDVCSKRKTYRLTHQVASSKSSSLVTSWLARENERVFTRRKKKERGDKDSRESRAETEVKTKDSREQSDHHVYENRAETSGKRPERTNMRKMRRQR